MATTSTTATAATAVSAAIEWVDEFVRVITMDSKGDDLVIHNDDRKELEAMFTSFEQLSVLVRLQSAELLLQRSSVTSSIFIRLLQPKFASDEVICRWCYQLYRVRPSTLALLITPSTMTIPTIPVISSSATTSSSNGSNGSGISLPSTSALRRFVVQFIPAFVLRALAAPHARSPATATLLSIYNAERDDSLPSSAPPAAEPSLNNGRALPALSSGAPPSSFGLSRAIGTNGSSNGNGSGGNDAVPLSGLPSLWDHVHLPSLDLAMSSIYHHHNNNSASNNNDTKKSTAGNHTTIMSSATDIAAISGPPSHSSAGVIAGDAGAMNGHYNSNGILMRLPCMIDDHITMTCHYVGHTATLIAANNGIAATGVSSLSSIKPITAAISVHQPPSPLGTGITVVPQLHDVALSWPLPVISQATDAVPIAHVAIVRLLSLISRVPLLSLRYLCLAIMRICDTGVEADANTMAASDNQLTSLWNIVNGACDGGNPSMCIPSILLHDLLTAATYAMAHPQVAHIGRAAVQAIAARASYDFVPDVMLATNCLL